MFFFLSFFAVHADRMCTDIMIVVVVLFVALLLVTTVMTPLSVFAIIKMRQKVYVYMCSSCACMLNNYDHFDIDCMSN